MQRGGKGDDGGKQGFPRQPRKENHKQPRSHNQRGGTQIGLLQNQGNGHGNNRQRGKIMKPRQIIFIALKKPRHRHRQPNFHDFRGLQAHKAEVEPARRAVYRDAKKMHAQQQHHAQHINRQGKIAQNVGANPRKNQQQPHAQNGVQGFVFQPSDVLPIGGVKQKHTHQIHSQHGVKQPRVKRIPK